MYGLTMIEANKLEIDSATADGNLPRAISLFGQWFENYANGDFNDIEALDSILSFIYHAGELFDDPAFENVIDVADRVLNDRKNLASNEYNLGDFDARQIGENYKHAPDLIELLFKYSGLDGGMGDPLLQCVIAANPFCSPEYLEKLSFSDYEWEFDSTQATVARNLRTPSETLRRLAESGDLEIATLAKKTLENSADR